MQVNSFKKINVLMIAPQFRPLIGGYERAAERLSEALVRLGLDITVVTERRKNIWPKEEISNGILIKRIPCLYRSHLHAISSTVFFSWFLILHGRRYDIWHVHQYGIHSTLALLIGILLRRPVVLKLTNTGDQGLAHTLSNGLLGKLSVKIHRNVDALVALSQETVQEAIAFGISQDKVHLLGNGVDVEIFRKRNSSERNLLRKKLAINSTHVAIFVGRLEESKNVEGLFEAWSLVDINIRKGWQLILVGEGSLRDDLEKLSASLMISESVIFVGHKPNIDEWLGASDLYISTSWREGLSNSLIEAMATGLPVVATCVSGVNELVENNRAGIVAQIGDMNKIAEGINFMMVNASLRNNYGSAGRCAIVSKYSLTKVATQTLSMYQSLLSR